MRRLDTMYTIDYQYLRPKKAIALKNWYDEAFPDREDLEVCTRTNATILPLRKLRDDTLQFGRGGVVDAEGQYVDLSCIPGRVQFSYPFSNAEFRDQRVVYCGYLIHQWGHFLIESVSRLWYFLENDSTIDKYVFFLDENETREIQGNYKEFLVLFGIWDKLEFINKPTTYREVVIPELGYQCRTCYSSKQMRVFETIAQNVQPDSSWAVYEKIYFSRSMFAKAQALEFGFDMLDNYFQKNGYHVLYPERIPLSQMIYYIRNAKVVTALQGSVCHNVFFANDGQQIEIVDRQVISDDNQVDINRMRGLQVTYIDANIPVYTIDCAGPYIMGYTDCLQRFTQQRGYLGPDERFLTQKHLKACFVKYFKAYQDLYRYNWFMHEWYAPFAESLYEGYQAGHAYFAEFLDGNMPYLWHHYLEFHYFKQFVKRILRKLGLYSK